MTECNDSGHAASTGTTVCTAPAWPIKMLLQKPFSASNAPAEAASPCWGETPLLALLRGWSKAPMAALLPQHPQVLFSALWEERRRTGPAGGGRKEHREMQWAGSSMSGL